MRIAVVSNTYQEGKALIEYRYRHRIASTNFQTGEYTLRDGNIIINCYGDDHANDHLSKAYDAYIVNPLYQSLESVIRGRCSREYE